MNANQWFAGASESGAFCGRENKAERERRSMATTQPIAKTMDSRLTYALDALDDYAAQSTDDRTLLIVAKCRGLIRGYHERWKDAAYRVETVENLVVAELWNPETQRKSRSFRIAGKLDTTGYADRRVVMDHKSTGEDISDPNSPYWRQLTIEGQVSHYSLLEWLNGRKVDEAVWDVMRKPGISPKNVTKADMILATTSGRYFGQEMTKATLAQLRETSRENFEMYEARLAFDCTNERPQWYFQRKTVARLDAELHEYATELWEHSQEILHARNTNRWARNSGACMLYGSPCKFLAVCSGHDTIDSDNWKHKANVHSELPMLEGDGRDVLTNSRIRCFQTCRRKHYLSYELGLERQDEEEREALLFGTIWHLALQVWFETSNKEHYDYSNADAPENDFGIAADAETFAI